MKTLSFQNDPHEDCTQRQRRLGRLTRVLHAEFGFLTLDEVRVLAKAFDRVDIDFFDVSQVNATSCHLGYINEPEQKTFKCVFPPAISRQLRRGDVFFIAVAHDGEVWRPIYMSPHLAARPAHDEWLEQFFSHSSERSAVVQ